MCFKDVSLILTLKITTNSWLILLRGMVYGYNHFYSKAACCKRADNLITRRLRIIIIKM